jgi:hypothetical protein
LQIMNGTYTQRRRMQMAGGGITNARQGYFLGGIGDFFGDIKDKIVDDIIPNEIKDSPVGTALLGGALVNQFGIPFTEGMGENWLGNLLGKIPGVPNIDTVIGKGGLGYTLPELIQGMPGQGTGIEGMDDAGLDPNWKSLLTQQVLDKTLSAADLPESLRGIVGSQVAQQFPNLNLQTAGQAQDINWQTPLAIGLAAGELQKRMSGEDVLPKDETGLDLPAIRAAALQGPEAARAAGLYFTPPASATTAYADGGRIGYAEGKSFEAWLSYRNKEIAAQRLPVPFKEWQKGEIDLKAQGGRIGAQEGGLMNLGGMEKDYRQEGGFVPIGGEEKADDVPARLSKNEFVFTADAVRAAGGGNIDAGAEVMENLMEHLEAGGKVSEDSQGLEGAQAMFANTQRLQNRII